MHGDETWAGRIERIVVFPSAKREHQATRKLVGWDLVQNHFFGRGNGLANGAADKLEQVLHPLGWVAMYSSTEVTLILATKVAPWLYCATRRNVRRAAGL
jgi:hypothetical protein